jgi:AbrB family looped-hinge helix DNA binding protein
MKTLISKVSKKGQITIPKEFREDLIDGYVEFIKEDDKIIIKKVPSVDELAGSLKKYQKNKLRKKLDEKDAWSEHVKEKYRLP